MELLKSIVANPIILEPGVVRQRLLEAKLDPETDFKKILTVIVGDNQLGQSVISQLNDYPQPKVLNYLIMLGDESPTSEARLDPEAPEFEYSVGLNANAAEF